MHGMMGDSLPGPLPVPCPARAGHLYLPAALPAQHTPPARPHHRRECPVGQAPALLLSSTDGCTYAECGKASTLEQPADGSGSLPANAAAMAAPAIVLTLIVVAFVEVLMHFC